MYSSALNDYNSVSWSVSCVTLSPSQSPPLQELPASCHSPAQRAKECSGRLGRQHTRPQCLL